MEPVRNGTASLLAGGLLLAIALALLIANDGGSHETPTLDSSGNAGATSNEVIAFWEDRVKANPGDFVAYNKLAHAYIQRARETGDVSDYSRAEAAVRASLEELPGDNFTAWALLASIQATKHDFTESLATAQRAIAIDPADPFGHAVLGDALLALGHYEDAYRTYQELAETHPSLLSFSRLAHVLELGGEIASADLEWRNALRTDGGGRPENTAWARVQVGNFYFMQAELDAAKDQYAEALKVFPSYVHALAGLGTVFAARGDYEAAIASYEDAVAQQPLPEYVAALGDVYKAAGDEAGAKRQYDLVVLIDSLYKANGINTDLQMSLFFADHDIRLDEALAQAEALYEKQPQSVYVADALAWALYKAGRPDEALAYSEQALRLGTQDAAMFFHAGVINYILGNNEAARDYLGRALEINPQFSVLYAEEAARSLRELQGLVRE